MSELAVKPNQTEHLLKLFDCKTAVIVTPLEPWVTAAGAATVTIGSRRADAMQPPDVDPIVTVVRRYSFLGGCASHGELVTKFQYFGVRTEFLK